MIVIDPLPTKMAASRPLISGGIRLCDKGMAEDPSSIFSGVACALIAGFAVLLCLPFADMGFIDDWSYVRTAYDFAQTGHFVYNGWATAMLGWQIVWSAPFLKLFGYSFTVARLSMLPFAMACGWLLHAVLRRSGISNRNAVFGSLVLCASPLFLPLAASYMSDVGGLSLILLCMYLCQRALEAKSDRAAVLWLCGAGLTNIVGGTERQVIWLGTLVLIPSAAWLMRKRRGVVTATTVLWLIGVAFILVAIHWFYSHPYSVPEKLFYTSPDHPGKSTFDPLLERMKPSNIIFKARVLSVVFVKTLFCLELILLPLLVAWFMTIRTLGRRVWITLGSLAAMLGVATWLLDKSDQLEGWLMPWIYHVLGTEAISKNTWDMLGNRPVSIPISLRIAISMLVVMSGAVFVVWLIVSKRRKPETSTSMTSRWQTLFILYLPYCAAYLVLLIPRGFRLFLFDRYLLYIAPVAILYLLKLHQERVRNSLPFVSYLTLAVFAIYGIFATHDLFALNRARVVAVNAIRSAGVPEDAAQAGFEYDGWSEIDVAQYINEFKIAFPADAYHPNLQDRYRPPDCRLGFDPYTPALHPTFIVVLSPMWCLEQSAFPPVIYHAWLPPFTRSIYIQRVPDMMQDLVPSPAEPN